jgi:integrase
VEINMPRGQKLPEVLTEEEEKKLLSQFNQRYPTSWRNQLMIRTALKTGMRISELIELRFEDMTPVNGGIRAHVKGGKGDKDRVLWIQSEIVDEMYVLAMKFGRTPTGRVFTTLRGLDLDDSYLRRVIRDKGRKSVDRRVHFHLLRHTALTRLYDATKDIRLVQDVAGHDDPKTTAIYAHTSAANLKEAMENL